MNRNNSLILAALISISLIGCGEAEEESIKSPFVEVHNGYITTMAEGIQFAEKPDYPAFIKTVSGMSGYETIGRWTEGKEASFVFVQNLPAKFTLDLEFAPAFGPDVGRVVNIEVGDWKNQFVASDKPKKVTFTIETKIPTDTIKFIIPNPISPAELGTSEDTREVGIMFKRLSILSDEIPNVVPIAAISEPATASSVISEPFEKPVPVVEPKAEKKVTDKQLTKQKKNEKPVKKAQ